MPPRDDGAGTSGRRLVEPPVVQPFAVGGDGHLADQPLLVNAERLSGACCRIDAEDGVGLAGVLASALLALPGAFNIGRDVRIYDPTTYAIGLACIAIPCVLAACLPALRASRIDPIATLRAE
jgi:hypothetical protein